MQRIHLPYRCSGHAAAARVLRGPLMPWRILLVWLLLVCAGGLSLPARAQTHEWTEALVLPLAQAERDDWSLSRRVPLPDEWSESRPGLGGPLVYQLTLQLRDLPQRPQALLIERACSLRRVTVNGQLLALHEAGEPRRCHEPRLIDVPAALLKAGQNTLQLQVHGLPLAETTARERAGALGAVRFGDHARLQTDHERRLWLAVRLPQILAGSLLLMGGFTLLLGGFHRAQSELFYFGGLMLAWAGLLSRPWEALPDATPWLGDTLASGLLALAAAAGVQFLLRLGGLRLPRVTAALIAVCVLMPLSVALVPPAMRHVTGLVWQGLLTSGALLAGGHHLAHLHRQQGRWRWGMTALLLLVAGAMTLDMLAGALPLDPRIGHLAQLLPPTLYLLLGLMLVKEFGQAFQSAEENRGELEQRIREATAQIERNFAQLAELKVEKVTEKERKRIAADLHDDLGAKLLTIVHTSDNDRISSLAREALEEMRLSVRGLTGKPIRLSDALGDWRAEVVSRLSQAGVQGEWTAPSDEETPQTLSARAFVQTTRILRESVSNVIKHSGASMCTVRTTIAEGDFQLVIQDNGHGIPTELEGRLDKGHGMASMKSRAKQLSGQCLVESGRGYGTVIRLTIPLERHVTPT
ncbi:sensor histidine kinase [Pseudaquabacterium rugosum]|uniref:ATP-binding protein n=1 Tax=Pseudaquabacterium rugosum TaxID=2984194 RepID=A0ABU9B6W3_9BURK